MKNKKTIIILIVCILVVICVDITIIAISKNSKDIKIKYSCKGSDKQKQIANTNSIYQEINKYEFYVTKDEKIESGAIISQFVFGSEDDYNIFMEQIDKTSEERIKEYDKENIKITYIFSNTFPNLKEEDKFSYTEDYLKQMEEKGFYCEKVE